MEIRLDRLGLPCSSNPESINRNIPAAVPNVPEKNRLLCLFTWPAALWGGFVFSISRLDRAVKTPRNTDTAKSREFQE